MVPFLRGNYEREREIEREREGERGRERGRERELFSYFVIIIFKKQYNEPDFVFKTSDPGTSTATSKHLIS